MEASEGGGVCLDPVSAHPATQENCVRMAELILKGCPKSPQEIHLRLSQNEDRLAESSSNSK